MKAGDRAFRAIARDLNGASGTELTEGLRHLVRVLARVPFGNGGRLAQATAGLIAAGAVPFVVEGVVVDRITDGREQAVRSPALAERAGVEPTMPVDAVRVTWVLGQVAEIAAASGISAYDTGSIVQAWFHINDWIPALLVPLQQKRSVIRAGSPPPTVSRPHSARSTDSSTWLTRPARRLETKAEQPTSPQSPASGSSCSTPPHDRNSLNIGRSYPLIGTEIRLDRVLPPPEAATWLVRIASANPTT